MNSVTERNKLKVRLFVEAVLNEGRLDLIDDLVAADYAGHVPCAGAVVIGPQGLRRLVSRCRSGHPGLYIKIEDQIAEDDRVVTRWQATRPAPGARAVSAATPCCAGISIIRLLAGLQAESRTEWAGPGSCPACPAGHEHQGPWQSRPRPHAPSAPGDTRRQGTLTSGSLDHRFVVMMTPGDLEQQVTLLTATARYDELRTREALASAAEGAGTEAGPSPLRRDEALELVALGEVIARKAAGGRQLTVRSARRAGASWSQIGAALGTSKQAAWEAHTRWIDGQADEHRRSGCQGLAPGDAAAARALAGNPDDD